MLTKSKVDGVVAGIGWGLMNAVRELDLACSRPIRGVEAGLCNIKSQFAADVAEGVHQAPPRDTKEEDTITWLLARTLRDPLRGELWVPYPGTRKTCDLVIRGPDDAFSLWVEVKLAWKAWFNCTGTVGRSSSYLPYLQGSKHKTHSAADDFDKLAKLSPPSAHLGLLLIGFDSAAAPMDPDVEPLAKLAHAGGWVADHVMWHDRRNPACRIHCWSWHHAPMGLAKG